MDKQLIALQSSYELALSTITTQKELLLTKLHELDNKFYPLQTLTDRNKYCVTKYIGNITTSTLVDRQLSNCVESALGTKTDASSAASIKTELSNYYDKNLLIELTACKNSHSYPSHNYTICVTQVVGTYFFFFFFFASSILIDFVNRLPRRTPLRYVS